MVIKLTCNDDDGTAISHSFKLNERTMESCGLLVALNDCGWVRERTSVFVLLLYQVVGNWISWLEEFERHCDRHTNDLHDSMGYISYDPNAFASGLSSFFLDYHSIKEGTITVDILTRIDLTVCTCILVRIIMNIMRCMQKRVVILFWAKWESNQIAAKNNNEYKIYIYI